MDIYHNFIKEWHNTSFTHHRKFSNIIISSLMVLIDVIVLVAFGLTITIFYIGSPGSHDFLAHFSALIIQVILLLGFLYFTGFYKLELLQKPVEQFKHILLASVSIFLFLLLLGFVFNISADLSRIWAFSTLLLFITLLSLLHTGFYSILHKLAKSGELSRDVMLVGGGEQTARWLKKFEPEKYPWIHVRGIFDDRSGRAPDKIGNIPIVGNIDNLISKVRELPCDDILVMMPWVAEERILEILKKLKVLPVRVRLGPDLISSDFPQCKFEQYGGTNMLCVVQKPIDDWMSILKSIEDRLFSFFILLFLSPVMLIIALFIKLESPGPVFFKQNRFGFNNQLIGVLKFRTMFIDQQDNDAKKLTTRDDVRVTKVGKFLRRTSLDELPQFINVLKGEMSIVGPRPHAIKASANGKLYQDVVTEYAVRHNVKPGITGWAQVNGWRGETDTVEKIAKRVEYDIYYIEHWSLLMDLKIMAITPFKLMDKNAF